MRSILGSLFSRSPFGLLQAHMDKVHDCVKKIPEIFEALKSGDSVKVDRIAKKISKLEHIADIAKQDIHQNLPKNIFLPIARETVLDFLYIQDSIANHAENIGVLLNIRPLSFLSEDFQDTFEEFLKKNIETFHLSLDIVHEMDQLIHSSFGGCEANKVHKIVAEVSYCEHEADLIQRKLLKILFNEDEKIPYPVFTLWLKVIGETGEISDLSEKLAYKVKNTLDTRS